MAAPRAIAAGLTAGALVLLAGCGTTERSGSGPTTSDTTASTTTGAPSGDGSTPTASLSSVIRRAVEEERHAEATYRNVLATLGPIRPFTNIAASESQHVAALEQLARTHGVEVDDIDPGGDPSPADRQQACALGVSAELADVELYDELLPRVSSVPDAVQVFRQLRSASQDQHLPAFERCA